MTLNDLMEFGHVIEVRSDGTVTDSNEYCPGVVYVNLDADGQTEYYDLPPGWSLMRGYTAQGDGAIMHPSEYIGGGSPRSADGRPWARLRPDPTGFCLASPPTSEPVERKPRLW